MGYFIDSTGFHKKTYSELKTEYENEFKAAFGDDIDLDPSGPFGELVGLLAQRDSDIWEGVEEIYNSRDPNAAEGMSLDKIAAETGIIRQEATETSVYVVLLYGTEGTLIEAGKEARQSIGDYSDMSYVLQENTTITKTAAREIELTVQTPADLEVFTITIDSVDYSYAASVGSDDAEEVAWQLKTAIEAGVFTGTVAQNGATLTITDTNTANDAMNIDWTANIDLDLLASGGTFEASLAGEIPLSANSLDTIVTPVSGWDSVINPNSGITGRKKETDSEFRIRRANTLFTGNATDDAMIRAISNNVSGITAVSMTSNREETTSSEDIPPHSYEVVVVGGDEDDIAQQIWLTQPSGIGSYGNTEKTVVDSQGITQTIYFSRPTPVYIHVRVSRDLYDEESYPSNGDDLIKEYIVDWSLINQTIGKDVIPQRLSTPIYQVPGVGKILIETDGTASPGDAPSYSTDIIEIANREYGDFATDRIVVQDLTP
ncbi:MAG: hypothetical protein PVI88_00290 [Nitrosopumilaceae archaeon]|jgi:uncharacterized phage protein gp47/JayE